MPDTRVIEGLSEVFRRHGFDGASLGRLSAATGLARASLYHRFPGGKEEMALEAGREWTRRFDAATWEVLEAHTDPTEALASLRASLLRLYADGELPCVFEALTRGEPTRAVQELARASIERFEDGLAETLRRAGCPADRCAQEARGIVRGVAGGLVLARMLDQPRAFAEVLEEIAERAWA